MIRRHLFNLVYLLAGAAVVFLLARRFGPWAALGLWSAVLAIACVLGGLLIRTAPLGQITWKNRVGGTFLRWGFSVSGGKLPGIVVTSWVVWTLVAMAVVFFFVRTRGEAAAPPDVNARPLIAILLFGAWLLNGSCLAYLLGNLFKYLAPGSPLKTGNVSVLGIAAGLVALIGGSALLWLLGKPVLALALAGGPLLIIGVLYGLFILFMVTAGRNARWN